MCVIFSGFLSFPTNLGAFSTTKLLLGLHQSVQLGEMYRMEACRGQASQLFYLDTVDYSKEMDKYEELLWEEFIK